MQVTMQMAMSLFNQAFGGIPKDVELVNKVHYYNEALAAAAITTEYDLFGAAPTDPLDWSLDQAGQMPYPVAVYGMAAVFIGDLLDWKAFMDNAYVQIVVADKNYPSYPVDCLPAAGGMNSHLMSDAAAAAYLVEEIRNGVAAAGSLLIFPPIAIDKGQQFKVKRRTKSGTITTASTFKIRLYCVEARDVR